MFALSAIPCTVVAKDALGASSFDLVVSIARQRSLMQLSIQLVVSFLETSQQETLHSLLHCQTLACHRWAIEAGYLINAVKEQSAGLQTSHQLCWIQHISKVTCYIRLCKCQTYSQPNERARVATNTIRVWDPLTWSWLELKSLPTQVEGRTRSRVYGCLKTHHHKPVVDMQLEDTYSISPEDRVTVLWPLRHRCICFSCKSQSHWFSAIVARRCLT